MKSSILFRVQDSTGDTEVKFAVDEQTSVETVEQQAQEFFAKVTGEGKAVYAREAKAFLDDPGELILGQEYVVIPAYAGG